MNTFPTIINTPILKKLFGSLIILLTMTHYSCTNKDQPVESSKATKKEKDCDSPKKFDPKEDFKEFDIKNDDLTGPQKGCKLK